ncbi:hypothetical protein Trydic_g19385 [Trypoxylus dichotomus]
MDYRPPPPGPTFNPEWHHPPEAMNPPPIFMPEPNPPIQTLPEPEPEDECFCCCYDEDDGDDVLATQNDSSDEDDIPFSLRFEAALTNLYATRKDVGSNFHIEVEELEQFIGMIFDMSLITIPGTRRHWTSKCGVSQVSSNPVAPFSDHLFKIRKIIESVRSKLKNIPLDQHLWVDEQIVPFKDDEDGGDDVLATQNDSSDEDDIPFSLRFEAALAHQGAQVVNIQGYHSLSLDKY